MEASIFQTLWGGGKIPGEFCPNLPGPKGEGIPVSGFEAQAQSVLPGCGFWHCTLGTAVPSGPRNDESTKREVILWRPA